MTIIESPSLPTTAAPVPSLTVFDEVPVRVIGPGELAELAAELASDCWRPAMDTETKYREALTVDNLPGRVRVISLAVKRADGSEAAFVIDLRDTPCDQVSQVLAPLDVVGWNANFDESALALTDGLAVNSWYDAMLADSVLRAGRYDVFWYRGLAAVSKQVLGVDLDGKGGVQLSYDLVTDLSDDQVRYAAADAVATRRVADWVRERVTELGLDLAVELENGARPFINAMMANGVPFNLDGYLTDQIAAKEREIADCLERLAALTEAKQPDPVNQLDLFAAADDADDANDVDVRPVPSWNPNSKPDLIMALNRWSSAEVMAYTGGRLLTAADSLRKNDMKQIGGELVKVVLKLKAASKEVSTYGADLKKYTRNGRFFSRYKQALVSTGRLASFSFNAQNMSKPMLRWMRAGDGRVLVYGDAGQAELRTVADLSGDADMLAAFESGEDFHTATAKSMFPGEDLDALATADPATAKKRRTAAKAVNFGLAYGMAAGLLATNLTVAGVPTTKEDAQGYLNAYFAARPTMANWLAERDAFVARTAAQLPAIDWVSTLKLYELRLATESARKAPRTKPATGPDRAATVVSVWESLRGTGPDGTRTPEDLVAALWPESVGADGPAAAETRQFRTKKAAALIAAFARGEMQDEVVADFAGMPPANKAPSMRELAVLVWPTGPEGAELTGDDLDAFHDRRAAELTWAWSYEGAVVLDHNGQPVSYHSTTASGRRRYFDIPMGNQGNDKFSGVVVTTLLEMCGTRKPAGRAYVEAFAADHGLELPDASAWRTERLRARALTVKAFEGAAGKQLRWQFLTGAIERFGMDNMVGLLNRAASDCMRSTRNAYRNHPVQGTVADIMEAAFANIHANLPAGAFPVLSVHDSVVIECDEADAAAVALLVRDAIEGSMRRFCPSVVPAADVDVRHSLDDADIIAEVVGTELVPVTHTS